MIKKKKFCFIFHNNSSKFLPTYDAYENGPSLFAKMKMWPSLIIIEWYSPLSNFVSLFPRRKKILHLSQVERKASLNKSSLHLLTILLANPPKIEL